jgi:para-nitrobenzyl esterase
MDGHEQGAEATDSDGIQPLPAPRARTASGVVEGAILPSGVNVFFGVPYAAPPVGELRFAPPAPAESWDNTLRAREHGPASLQPVDLMVTVVPETEPLFLPAGIPTSEDCLYLDVFSPSLEAELPVIVWIHGGGWATGTGAASWTNGETFAANENVVIVTINYRLGLLGQLDVHASGDPEATGLVNFGILDQIAALRWVQHNIRAFGGDPGRVAVMGESAGAFSAIQLLTAPDAQGLFHAAIAESGHAGLVCTPEQSRARTALVLQHLGIPAGTGALAALRELPAETFIATSDALGMRAIPPVSDGTVLAADPLSAIRLGQAKGMSLLVGSNRDEFRSFRQLPVGDKDPEVSRDDVLELLRASPDPQQAEAAYLADADSPLVDVLDEAGTDRDWRAPIRRLARACAEGGVECFVFEFVWPGVTLGGRLGSSHQGEIPFVFDTLDAPGVAAIVGDAAADPRGRAQARLVQGAFAAFARDGHPMLSDGLPWQPWSAHDESVAVLEGGRGVMVQHHRAERLDVWEPQEES